MGKDRSGLAHRSDCRKPFAHVGIVNDNDEHMLTDWDMAGG